MLCDLENFLFAFADPGRGCPNNKLIKINCLSKNKNENNKCKT